jgi:hypothetical protein
MDVEAGNLLKARERGEAALLLAREIGDIYLEGTLENDIGFILRRMRLHAEALEKLYRARDIFRRLKRDVAVMVVTYNLGDVLADQGRVEAAAAEYESALSLSRSLEGKPYISHILELLGWVAIERGDLARGRTLCGEAHAAADAEVLVTADAYLCIARIELDEGHFAAAAQQASKAAELFGNGGHVEGKARAQALQARALLADGRAQEAAASVAAARAAIAGIQSRRARAQVGVAAAQVQAAQPAQLAAAIAALREVVAEAEQTSSMVDQLEARLALADLLARAGDAEGQQQFAAVAQAASTRGLVRLARKAQGH